MALKLPNTGMATAIDIGAAGDIHPTNKQDVGRRLALWAQAEIYQRKIVHSGPVYQSMKTEGNRMRLTFDHTGSGLEAKGGGPLRQFAIAGTDQKFVWADTRIDGDSIVVSSPQVPPRRRPLRLGGQPGGLRSHQQKRPARPALPHR